MTARETKRRGDENPGSVDMDDKFLILYNDEVHTFDYVIQALMEVCNHDYIQASQCTIITHYKGKCDIKQGKMSSLKIMKDALTDKELTVTID